MDNTTTKTKVFSKAWFSEPKNVITFIIGAALCCGLLYLFGTYVLPWLVTVTWNLVNLVLGIVCLGVALIIFTNRKFWRAIKYLSEFIGRYTLGLVIELNPFNILEMRIERAVKDRETLKTAGNKVSGKKVELETKINNKQRDLKSVIGKADALKLKAQECLKTNNQDEAALIAADYQVEAAKATQLKEYVDALTPIVQDLGFLENHYKKVYKLCGTKIEISKSELELGRDRYESVMSGAGVASAAWKAIVGNDEMNRDAELAIDAIQRKVSNSLAEMKNTMDLTNDIIRSVERDNFAKAKEGMDLIKQMELTGGEYKTTAKSDWNDNGQLNQESSYSNLMLEELTKN